MLILTFIDIETNTCLLMLSDPPATPQVGDITAAPDGKLYAVVSRAFLVSAPKTSLMLANGNAEPTVEVRCTLAEINEEGEFIARTN